MLVSDMWGQSVTLCYHYFFPVASGQETLGESLCIRCGWAPKGWSAVWRWWPGCPMGNLHTREEVPPASLPLRSSGWGRGGGGVESWLFGIKDLARVMPSTCQVLHKSFWNPKYPWVRIDEETVDLCLFCSETSKTKIYKQSHLIADVSGAAEKRGQVLPKYL